MVVSVSFQKRIPPGSVNGRGTLAEMMARQKAYADSRGAIMQEETPTIMQGLGKVANVMVNAWGERQAMDAETAGRERLAAIRAGIDLDKGATSEQIGEAGVLDEDYARQLQEQALQLRRDAAERALTAHGQDITEKGNIMSNDTQRHGQDITEKGNIMSDATQRAGQTITREGNEMTDATQRAGQVITQQGNEMTDATQRAGQVITQQGNEMTDATQRAGQKITQSGNQLTADVQREGYGSAERIADAKAKADLANDPKYEPPSPEDIAKYNLQPAISKGASFRIKIVNGQREPEQIGTAPQDTPLSGEVSGKLGYMTDFLQKFPDLQKRVADGAVSGIWNVAKMKMGAPGEATNILREIQTGYEGLIRGLTGAGMPVAEATTYAGRYEPSYWSALGPEESITKLNELNTDMWNVYNAVRSGHKWTENPEVFKLRIKREEDAANPAPAGGGPAPAAPVDLVAEQAEAQRVIDQGGDEAAIRAEFAKSGGDPSKLRPKGVQR